MYVVLSLSPDIAATSVQRFPLELALVTILYTMNHGKFVRLALLESHKYGCQRGKRWGCQSMKSHLCEQIAGAPEQKSQYLLNAFCFFILSFSLPLTFSPTVNQSLHTLIFEIILKKFPTENQWLIFSCIHETEIPTTTETIFVF